MSILKKGLTFIIINLIIETCFVGSLIYMQNSLQADLESAEFHQNVLIRLNEILKLWHENTIELLRYTVGGREFTSVQQQRLYLRTRSEATQLAMLLKDDKKNEKLILEVRDILDAGFPLLKRVRDTYFNGDFGGHLVVFRKLHDLSDRATRRVEVVLGDYRTNLNAGLDRQNSMRDLINKVLAAGILFNIALSTLAAWLFFKTIAARLSILQANMLHYASAQPLLPMLESQDEIGKLNRGFKEMAAAVEESNRQKFEVLQNARDLICSLNGSGAFIACNEASEQLLGYKPEELFGMRLANIVDESSMQLTNEMLKQVQSGSEVKPFELKMKTKNGRQLELLWSVKSSNESKNVFCVAHDVTERRQLERMKQDFMLMVSHDLRSPLMSVHGVLTLLYEGAIKMDEKGRSTVKSTLANVDRLTRLITDLLDVQKMEEGQIELLMGECSPAEIVDDAVRAVSSVAESKDVAIQSSVEEGISFQADKDRIVQVLVNLLSNAIKFSPPDSLIRINVLKTQEYLRFEVVDEGAGVPENKKETIFTRFGQASSQHGKAGQGFGLGLTICRELVEKHAGQIGVEDVSAGGSLFWFTIPL